MESESRTGAAAQLGELNTAVRAARGHSDPAPPWWFSPMFGFVGPAAVFGQHESYVLAALCAVVAIAGTVLALRAEQARARFRRRRADAFSLRGFLGLFGMIVALNLASRWFLSDDRTQSVWLLALGAWCVAAVIFAVTLRVLAGARPASPQPT